MFASYSAAVSAVTVYSFLAQVHTYECNSIPTEAGWVLVQNWCGAQQQATAGLLVQDVDLCRGFGNGQAIDHEHIIGDLDGSTSWFAEWRMSTTGISEEIPFVAPSALVVWDGNALIYHFTMADDEVRFIQQTSTLFFDIEPGALHTYRIELVGDELDELYRVYIDGALVATGAPDGPLMHPDFDPLVNMHAQAKLVPSTTTWDFIRWGDIPSSVGDFNSDGEVDDQDLPFFEECLETESGNWVGCAWADFEADGDVDCADAVEFQLAWTGAGDPPSFKSCAAVCGEDLNNDDAVDAADLAILLGGWGANPGHAADFNDDDAVNASDLAVLLGNWGPCP